MILLAAAIAAQLAPGCRRVQRSVLCELAPPAPPSRQVAPLPPGDEVRGPRPSPHRVRSIAKPPPSRADPPDEAVLARQIETLTAIADCTGVRTYLTGIGRTDLAAAAFDRCVAGAPPPPRPPR